MEMVEGVAMNIVLVHGSFGGGWNWKKVAPGLRAAGHLVLTPTLTGVGERSHLLSPSIGLETHIQDIVNVLTYEDLHDVLLVGHSWGGMVITGVAESQHARIARLVYLDAFIPQDNQSVFDISSRAGERWRVKEAWGLVPPHDPASSGITDPDDVAWVQARRAPMSIKTHEDRIRLPHNHASSLPRSYIWCTESPGFAGMAEIARSEGWDYHELPTNHSPMVTIPNELTATLLQIAEMTQGAIPA